MAGESGVEHTHLAETIAKTGVLGPDTWIDEQQDAALCRKRVSMVVRDGKL